MVLVKKRQSLSIPAPDNLLCTGFPSAWGSFPAVASREDPGRGVLSRAQLKHHIAWLLPEPGGVDGVKGLLRRSQGRTGQCGLNSAALPYATSPLQFPFAVVCPFQTLTKKGAAVCWKRRCSFLKTALQFFGNGAAVVWKRRCSLLETALQFFGNGAAVYLEQSLFCDFFTYRQDLWKHGAAFVWKRRCSFLETALQFLGNGTAVFWKQRCCFVETALHCWGKQCCRFWKRRCCLMRFVLVAAL
jgi:hypothetical protein